MSIHENSEWSILASVGQATATASGDGGNPKPPSGIGRGAARRFVALFVIYSVVPLLVYHYGAASKPMGWYLFETARHTTWLLGKIGDSCNLENAPAFVGREGEVRAVLHTQDSRDPAKPLSSWELWNYRVAVSKFEVAWMEDAISRLELGKHLEVAGDADTQLVAKSRLEQLVLATRYHLPGSTQEVSIVAPGVKDELSRLQADYEALLSGGGAGSMAGFQDLAQSLMTPCREQQEFLKQRLRTQQMKLSVLGAPLVCFVYDAGAPKRLEYWFKVPPECSAMPLIIIYLAAVLAFPAVWKWRLFGGLFGVPVLYVVNILRLTCLAVIGALTAGGAWFRFAHEYVWQGIYVVFVVAVWMFWAEFVVAQRRRG